MKSLLTLSLLALSLNFAYAEDNFGSFCPSYVEKAEEKQPFNCSFCESFTVEEFKEAVKGKELEADLDDYGLTQLMCASYNKDLTMAKELIKAGAKVNATNSAGKNIFMIAARVNKNPEMLKLLLENGADISARDMYYGRSALTYAAGSNTNPEILKLLLENGFCLGVDCDNGDEPLDWAVGFNENPEILKFLISKGAEVNSKLLTGYHSPLMSWKTEQKGRAEKVKILIDNGAVDSDTVKQQIWREVSENNDEEMIKLLKEMGLEDFYYSRSFCENFTKEEFEKNVKPKENLNKNLDGMGLTPLMCAVFNKDITVAKELIEAGENIHAFNEVGKTILMIAARINENPEMVKLLLEKGADVNAKDEDGRTALIWASAGNNNPEVHKLLIKAGADVNDKAKYSGQPLDWAIRFNSNPEVLKTLLEAGANVNFEEYKFLIAAVNNNVGLVKPLLDSGIDVNQTSSDSWTALMLLARNDGDIELAKLILDKKAKLYLSNNDKWTALHLAARYHNPDFMKLLLDAGADVEQKTKDGYTPLMLALYNDKNSRDLVKLLLDAGANAKVKNNDGKTALDLTKELANLAEVVKLLEEKL